MSLNDGTSPEMRLFASPELGQPLSAKDAERLLAGQGAAPDAPEDQQALATLLRHAAGPAQKRELAGEVSAIAAFAMVREQKAGREKGPVRTASRRRRAGAAGRWRWRLPARRRPLVAACASAAVVMALSGTAAADALPASMQKVAHDTFGAPAPRHPAPSVKATPSGQRGKHPSATAAGTAEKPTSSPSSHGNGKAVGKAKTAKPTPHGEAKGHTAAPGHHH